MQSDKLCNKVHSFMAAKTRDWQTRRAFLSNGAESLTEF